MEESYILGKTTFEKYQEDCCKKYNPYHWAGGDWLKFEEGYNAAKQEFLNKELRFKEFKIELRNLCKKFDVIFLTTGCGKPCGSGGVIKNKEGKSFTFRIKI